jgi:hypothetical protein
LEITGLAPASVIRKAVGNRETGYDRPAVLPVLKSYYRPQGAAVNNGGIDEVGISGGHKCRRQHQVLPVEGYIFIICTWIYQERIPAGTIVYAGLDSGILTRNIPDSGIRHDKKKAYAYDRNRDYFYHLRNSP